MKISGWWCADVWWVQLGRHSPNLGCQGKWICKSLESNHTLCILISCGSTFPTQRNKICVLHIMSLLYPLFAWVCMSMQMTCPKLPAVLFIWRSGASWPSTCSQRQAFVHNLPWWGQDRVPFETEGILCEGSEQRACQLEETQWDWKCLDQCLHPCRGSPVIGALVCLVEWGSSYRL